MTAEIIGLAALAPGARSAEELFDLLIGRRCSVTEIPNDRWDKARYWHPSVGVRGKTYTFAAGVLDDCYAFDPAVFGISRAEAEFLDPQQRIILEVVWRALEDANIDYADLSAQRVGVYVGASSLDHGNLVVEDPGSAGPYFMTGNTLSIVSNRISHVFSLHGPSLTVDTACSSSLVALDQAFKALQTGEIDLAIVGGVNVLAHPLSFVGFAQARMLSPDGLCRAYDDNGSGYVRSEGAAAVVLRRSDTSRKLGDRSRGRILSTGVNSSGRTNGISLPSAAAQLALLRSIYVDGGIDPADLVFVEGHGTGTKVGDPAEITAVGMALGQLRQAPIPIGSIKSNIGHAEPASGLLGMLKAVMALEHDRLPASLHFETPNHAVDFTDLNVHVATEPVELSQAARPRLAGVNSFGFGGTNAHVVVGDTQPAMADPAPVAGAHQTVLVSAHTQSALRILAGSYVGTFDGSSAKQRRRIAAASGTNRHPMRHRFVVSDPDASVITHELRRFASGSDPIRATAAEAVRESAKTAFVFSGNGAQWAGMAIDAYRGNASFRKHFDGLHDLFEAQSGIRLNELLIDGALSQKLLDTRVAQPLLFAIQAALADVFAGMGVRPSVVLGHSVGEIGAAYAAHALSLIDAVNLVVMRSAAQHEFADQGGMAAVRSDTVTVNDICSRNGLTDLCVAGDNAPGSVTLSGPSEQIRDFAALARDQRLAVQILDIRYPFHHPLIEPVKDRFIGSVSRLSGQCCEATFLSTVTGEKLDGDALDADYWWRNVREPVLFRQATAAALDLGCDLFVEIGPRPILSSYIRDTIRAESSHAVAIPSLLREAAGAPDTGDPIGAAFARILAHGGSFDRGRVFGPRRADLTLPRLSFERQEIRPGTTSDAVDLYGRRRLPHSLAGWRVDPASGSFKNHIDAHLYPALAEHVVDGQPILPGSGFLEIALSAARQFLESDALDISDLEIVRPLDLSHDTLREIGTIISPATGDIEIRSRQRFDEDWTLHATARARRLAATRPAGHNKSAVTTGGVAIDGAVAYATARRFKLDYGPNFRLLKQARYFSENRRIDVILKAPSAPAHPHLDYLLNPISVDAVFHGLVAAFEELSGDREGAPFVPIRFGRVRLHAAGKTVERASILIHRVGDTSINVDFRLFDASGNTIAVLADCRFKRTHLKRPRHLNDVSYQQALVPSPVVPSPVVPSPVGPRPDIGAAGTTVAESSAAAAPDPSQQMLEAAIYRACYDIARRLARKDGKVAFLDLPGGPVLRPFLTNCLCIVSQAGFATEEKDCWLLSAECDLPPTSAILQALDCERPDRAVEVAAINSVLREALARIEAIDDRMAHIGTGGAHASGKPAIGEATLRHLERHSAPASARSRILVRALDDVLGGRKGGIVQVAEIGMLSRATTAELVRSTLQNGGVFTAVEPDEASRQALSSLYRDVPQVSIAAPSDDLPPVDIIVSGWKDLYGLIERDAELCGKLKAWITNGARLILCMSAPSDFLDFTLGLTDGWFDRSQSFDFPVGRTASVSDWRLAAVGLGVENATLRTIEGTCGDALVLDGERPCAPGLQDASAHESVLVLRDEAEDDSFGSFAPPVAGGKVQSLGLSDDDAGNRTALTNALEDFGEKGPAIVYLCSSDDGRDAQERLQCDVARLSSLAGIFEDREGKTAPTFAVVLRPAADGSHTAANCGIQAFLRVLRNEFQTLAVHTVDLSALPQLCAPDCVAHAMRLLAGGGGNREWVIRETGETMEVRAIAGPFVAASARTSVFSCATVRQRVASRIGSLVWESCTMKPPEPDEIQIEVSATGLNFRDIMWSMGMLPEEALEHGFAGAAIGMECSGRVTAIGSAVEDFAVGDPVMAIASAAFSTCVNVPSFAACRVPADIDLVAAATLPVAFVTAWYALVDLAQLAAGDMVLVHGGAGGVGLAALQIAKARGAKAIATAGTVEKRRYLRLLGADHVFDSRSLEFVDKVLAVTRNEGVDVVLNSLSSEAMERSLSLVKPFGRFLELGKRDFYADTKLGLRPFRRNISYFGIDADQLLSGRPHVARQVLSQVSAGFARGELRPLPYRAFAHDEISDAFRLMQGSGHIGKIVVTPPVAGRDAVAVAERGTVCADPDGIHLVVGGIGGFGLAAANWLVDKGARRIALCTRHGVADAHTEAMMGAWSAAGVNASLHVCDVTNETAVASLLEELRNEAPLKGIVHAAMVLDDALISNLTAERNRPVIEAKAKGAMILDRLTRPDDLDLFLLFSSATTLLGNPGQANYVAANGFLEGLARARRSKGLPALAVGFGAISDVGVLQANAGTADMLARRIGRTAMTAREALALLDRYLARDPGTVDAASFTLAEIDWHAASGLATVASPLLARVARFATKHAERSGGGRIDLHGLVAGKSPEEGARAVLELVTAEIAAVLKIPATEVTPTKVLRDIGIDSLMTMELGLGFRQRTGVEMPLSSVTQSVTVTDIADKLYRRIAGASDGAVSAEAELVGELAGRHTENQRDATA